MLRYTVASARNQIILIIIIIIKISWINYCNLKKNKKIIIIIIMKNFILKSDWKLHTSLG